MRLNESWIEFKGVQSTAYQVKVMDEEVYVRAEARGISHTAAGRSGDLWQSDNSSETVDIKRRLRFPRSQLDAVAAWLNGSGLLRFSTSPNRAWDARAVKSFEVKAVVPGADWLMETTVTWTCQPFRQLYPAANPITITTSGTLLEAQGTALALPKIEIYGSGDFMLSIGRDAMYFNDISGGVIVDSELQDALTLDGAGLLNNNVGGDFFEIDPTYTNTVNWTLESGASVTKVIITPRWRYI